MIFFMSMCLLSEMSTWFSSQKVLRGGSFATPRSHIRRGFRKSMCALLAFSRSPWEMSGKKIESPPLRSG